MKSHYAVSAQKLLTQPVNSNTVRTFNLAGSDVADRAGIDPSHVVAPYCAETAAPQDDGDGPGSENLKWCGVSVIIDNDTSELFEMSPDDDPEQKPAFLVTQSTANLVRQDFERYEPSLERNGRGVAGK